MQQARTRAQTMRLARAPLRRPVGGNVKITRMTFRLKSREVATFRYESRKKSLAF